MLSNKWLQWVFVGITVAYGGLQMSGQSTVVQLPNINVAAGIPSGSTQTICSASIATPNGTQDGDGCPATQATFSGVQSVATDGYGNIYFADSTHTQLRVLYNGNSMLATAIAAAYPSSYHLTAASIKIGTVYTISGGCSTGSSGCYASTPQTGLQGNATILSNINAVALDGDGNVFFFDGNHLRMFFVNSNSTKVKSLFVAAGAATSTMTWIQGDNYLLLKNYSGYNGDGTSANSATTAINTPHGLVVDANENIYIADTVNNAVRKVTASTGIISTFVGGPGCVQGTSSSCTKTSTGDGGPSTSATTAMPWDLTFDSNGNLYVVENYTKKVRVVYLGTGAVPGITSPVTGDIYTVAGGGSSTNSGASALNIQFTGPTGIGLDANDNIYIADSGNRVWMIDKNTRIGVILAGGGSATPVGGACSSTNANGSQASDKIGDGCLGIQATLSTPNGRIAFDASRSAYITDSGDNIVRVLNRNNVFSATSLGSSSAMKTLGFVSLATQTLGAVGLGIEGNTGSDFANAGLSTCSSGLTFNAGTTCLLNLAFTPMLPGGRKGFLQLSSSTSSVIGGFYLGGQGTGAEIAVDAGTQANVGTGIAPSGIAADAAGNLYIADTTSASLLQYAGSSATVPVALITGLSSPGQVAVDGEGNVAVADAGNNRVAVYNKAGQIVSTSGTGLNGPQGVAFDTTGDLYIADTGNSRVIEIAANGATRVLSATLTSPARLSFDGAGNLYILDSSAAQIVEIPGATGSQSNVSAATYTPSDMALDAAGNLYVLDSAGLQVGVVSSSGSIYTLLSGLKHPSALAVDALGNVYVADSQSSSGIALNRQLSTIQFGNINRNTSSLASSFLLTSIGSQDTQFSSSAVAAATGDMAVFSITPGQSGGCSSTLLTVGSRCSLSATFTPTSVQSYNATLTFPSNVSSANATVVKLQGAGVQLNATAVAVTLTSPSSMNNLQYGTPLILSVTLTPVTGTGTPTGTFAIYVNGIKQTTVAIGSGTVSYSVTPDAGPVVVTAVYSGDTVFASSNGAINLTVLPVSTSTALTIAYNLSIATPNIVLTAQVSSVVPGVTGIITFYNGSTALGIVTLDAKGAATLTLTNLALTNLAFSADYSGTSNFAASNSGVQNVSQDFGMTTSLSASTVQGGIATTSFTVTPYFGLSGTIQFSCSGLPANSVCRPFPQTISLTGSNDPAKTVQLQIFTSIAPETSKADPMEMFHTARFPIMMVALFFLWPLRRAKKAGKNIVWLICVGMLSTLTLVGCSSSPAPTPGTQAGVYNVTLTATASNGAIHNAALTLTVGAK